MKIYISLLESPENSGIFHNQIRPLRKLGYQTLIFYPIFKVNRKNKFALIRAEDYSSDAFDYKIPVPVPSFFSYPGIFMFVFLWIYVNVALAFMSIIKNDISEVRGRNAVLGAILSLGQMRMKAVIDIRGVIHDEARLLGRSKYVIYSLLLLEKITYNLAKKITAVTKGVAAYIKISGCKQRVEVFEPFIPDSLDIRKKASNLSVARNIVFLGTVSPWNDIRNIERIKHILLPDDNILFLGNISSGYQNYVKNNLTKICDFDCVSPKSVPSMLASRSHGLILGSFDRKSITTRTMIPSKLYEYLNFGLIPMLPVECKSALKFIRAKGIRAEVF